MLGVGRERTVTLAGVQGPLKVGCGHERTRGRGGREPLTGSCFESSLFQLGGSECTNYVVVEHHENMSSWKGDGWG